MLPDTVRKNIDAQIQGSERQMYCFQIFNFKCWIETNSASVEPQVVCSQVMFVLIYSRMGGEGHAWRTKS